MTRAVRIGGMNKRELLSELQRRGIELNEAGRTLLAHAGFTTSAAASILQSIELTVAHLGLHQGATMSRILDVAALQGYSQCPLELGPHLRLQYLDQPELPEEKAPAQHQAPAGSITIVSAPISPDEDLPKGFYLRRSHGNLWLRGYRSGPAHLWSPEDHLVFQAAAL